MKVWIENKEYFEDIFEKGSVGYRTLWRNILTGEYEIENDSLIVSYDNYGGFAIFDVISQGPIWLKIEFTGTAK